MRRAGVALWSTAIALGVVAEWAAYSWDEPKRWVPDLAVGLAFVACGWFAWTRRRAPGAAVLLAATGFAWFAGNFDDGALYLHRGPLVHLLLAYPGWRPRRRMDTAAIIAGYAAALLPATWGSERATVVLAAALVGVVAYQHMVATGRARGERRLALLASAALGIVLVGGVAARAAVPSGDAVEPLLFVYEAALVAIAFGLTGRLREPEAAGVADLVVELTEAPSGTLRERLSRALGDPSLEVGYWSVETGTFVDDAGRVLGLASEGDARSRTHIDRGGAPFAVLLHDAAVLDDPALVAAVGAATRLSASNAALNMEVQGQVAELTSSRRRLLVAADDERRRLEARLREGPERRLVALGERLARVPAQAERGDDDAVERARRQLVETVAELRELARGLHPGELAEAGLGGAVASLADRAPVPVDVEVATNRLPAHVEATVYFLCAEALANVAKYAAASRASVEVAVQMDHLVVVVADDGVGGADASRGTGLRGLVDRVETLGGALHVASVPGQGTRIAAEIPLGAALDS